MPIEQWKRKGLCEDRGICLAPEHRCCDNLFDKRSTPTHASLPGGKTHIQEDLWGASLTWGIPYKFVINKDYTYNADYVGGAT